jgi:3,5-dihydroxyphenylacetyl-CoA synthase
MTVSGRVREDTPMTTNTFGVAEAALAPSLVSRPAMAGVGTAVPPDHYSQGEVLDLMRIVDPRVRSVFANSAIERRFLSLPARDADGAMLPETQGDLLAKHRRSAVDIGVRALAACLADAEATPAEVEFLCCVTSTGFLTPGLSAFILQQAGIDPACHRLDVVGMGCNAGLNAMNTVAGWSMANPGRLAVMVCAEACSAAYVVDGTMRTAVVNSLFGDGAAAVALRAPGRGDDPGGRGPRVLAFASHLIPEAMDAMRYDWDDHKSKFSFYLDPDIPYVVGANSERVVDRLLTGAGLRRSDIAQWLVHSGGKKVIDAVRINLGLTRHDLRHTSGVLRDYGNLSSGSFLFSYQRLLTERVVRTGDYGVLMTMGPGSTIETALIQW